MKDGSCMETHLGAVKVMCVTLPPAMTFKSGDGLATVLSTWKPRSRRKLSVSVISSCSLLMRSKRVSVLEFDRHGDHAACL